MKKLILVSLASLAIVAGQAPDNTKTNSRDRDPNAVTADDQKMNPSDRDLVAKIRKSVYDDKSLSTYAHNVKIVVQNGMVTLKGPVRSQSEKEVVEQKAATLAGAKNVTNQLDIAPEKK